MGIPHKKTIVFWAKVKRLNSQKPVVDEEECHCRVVDI